MRHIASITVVLCLLFASSFAIGQNQRVFVSTSFPAVSLPSQLNQQVILASQPVGLSMKQLWSFDIFADGSVNFAPSDYWTGRVDVWACDKSDCSGTIKANVVDSLLFFTFGNPTWGNFLHLTATAAQTNPGHPSVAVLTGQLSYRYSDGNPQDSDLSLSGSTADLATPATQPIDLYTGNR